MVLMNVTVCTRSSLEAQSFFCKAWVLGASAVSMLPRVTSRTAEHAVGFVGLSRMGNVCVSHKQGVSHRQCVCVSHRQCVHVTWAMCLTQAVCACHMSTVLHTGDVSHRWSVGPIWVRVATHMASVRHSHGQCASDTGSVGLV